MQLLGCVIFLHNHNNLYEMNFIKPSRVLTLFQKKSQDLITRSHFNRQAKIDFEKLYKKFGISVYYKYTTLNTEHKHFLSLARMCVENRVLHY